MIESMDTENGSKLSICDNGGGIPQEILEKIFDSYFSTKSEKMVLGLGYICLKPL